MIVLEGKNVPIKSWCNKPEQGAIDQAIDLAELPFIFNHVALMPDTHQGYGMPIGGVIGTLGVVIPNAVGVDIGCGMRAVKTSIKREEMTQENIKKIFGGSKEYKGGIRSKVPVGFSHRSKPVHEDWLELAIMEHDIRIMTEQMSSAKKQLGTLGGGNHFIEIQYDQEDYVWFMIHSGSRNLGKRIAEHYHNVAKDLCYKWYSDLPTPDLSFLPIDSEEGKEYLDAMNFALRFAKENRYVMMKDIQDSIREVIHCTFHLPIDVHHNYARMEHHFGKNVMIHRKGATSAKDGEVGIIPGSQGSCSYIVKGKGNAESFMSCSHGAGRKMSRTKAKNELVLEDEIKVMNDKGIVHGIKDKNHLDEASGAYKDINIVMKEQEDLIDILYTLKPLGVIKG